MNETPLIPPGSADEGEPTAVRRRMEQHQAWLQALAREPGRVDFYQALRRFEAAYPELPRLGEAVRPSDEPLRLGQPPDLSFAPTAVHGVKFSADRPPHLSQRIFGLMGPNGPLPTHLSELVGERQRHHGDAGPQRFIDLLTHRWALLFYRAWAQAQLAIDLDRAGDGRWALRLGALGGIGSPPLRERDALGDSSKLHFTGRLARQSRDAEGLLAWCRSEFDVPARLEQWCGHWMPLAPEERSRLGDRSCRGGPTSRMGLGGGAVMGAAVWDVQHKFRLVIGPLRLARYLAFLPDGTELPRLQAMVRQWLGLELQWDLQLLLDRRDVPRSVLGQRGPQTHGGRLGRTGWIGSCRKPGAAGDLRLDVEQALDPRRRRPAGVPA